MHLVTLKVSDVTCNYTPIYIPVISMLLTSQSDIPYTQNFLWYVNFTDFAVNRAAVKIYSMKILPPGNI